MPRVALALLAALLAFQGTAQDYPSKPVHVYVPSSRAVPRHRGAAGKPQARETLGQPSWWRTASPRRHRGHSAARESACRRLHDHDDFRHLRFQPASLQGAALRLVKDFAPIMLMVRYPQILVVHPSSG